MINAATADQSYHVIPIPSSLFIRNKDVTNSLHISLIPTQTAIEYFGW